VIIKALTIVLLLVVLVCAVTVGHGLFGNPRDNNDD
jgi:hypothetical protein